MGEETSGGTRVKDFYERQVQSLVMRRKMRIIVYRWKIGERKPYFLPGCRNMLRERGYICRVEQLNG